MKKQIYFFLLFLIYSPLYGATPTLELNLERLERDALVHSAKIRAAEHAWKSAQNLTLGQKARRWPILSLDGSWKYLSEIPTLPSAMSAGKTLYLGDHENYSFGPQLAWTFWDSKNITYQWKSFEAKEGSLKQELEWKRQQVLLQTRLAYFQVRIAIEQVRLLEDSFNLAQAQYADIESRRRAGVSNRIDSLSAHQEVLDRSRLFRQARTELSQALRDLFTLTGNKEALDLSLPLHQKIESNILRPIKPASLFVSMEEGERIRTALQKQIDLAPDEQLPNLRAFSEMIESVNFAIKSVQSGHGPKLQLLAKTSLDRPNGPAIETFNQNMVGFTASLPLFEGGRLHAQVEELQERALQMGEEKNDARSQLLLNWNRAQDQIAGLEDQQKINLEQAQETEELARLIYASYKTGTSNYIEVQVSNLRALEAKVRLARTEAQIFIQMATLASLSGKKEAGSIK